MYVTESENANRKFAKTNTLFANYAKKHDFPFRAKSVWVRLLVAVGKRWGCFPFGFIPCQEGR